MSSIDDAVQQGLARRATLAGQQTPQQSSQQSPQSGFKLSDILPVLGGIAGGGIGLLGGPLGVAAGGAVGSGLGEALRQNLEGENNPSQVGLQAGLGALPLGKFLGLGRVVGVGAKAATEAASEAAPNIVQKGANAVGELISGGGPKEFIQRNAHLANPVDLTQALLSEGILGKLSEKGKIRATEDALGRAGTALDQVLQGSTFKVQSKDLANMVGSHLQDLYGSGTAQQRGIKQIMDQLANFGKFDLKSGQQTLTAAALQKIKAGLYKFGPRQINVPDTGPLVKDMAGESARFIRGMLEHQVPEATPALRKYAALSTYRNEVLNTPGGAKINTLGGVVGALTGSAQTIANKGLQTAYNVAGKGATQAVPSTTRQLASIIGGQTIGRSLIGGILGGGALAQNSSNQTPDTTNQEGIQATPAGPSSEEYKQMATQVANLMLQYPKQAQDIKAAWDTYSQAIAPQQKMTTQMQNMQQTLKPARQALDQIGQLVNQGITGPQNNLAKFSLENLGGTGVDQRVVSLNQRFALAKQLIVRSLQGARMSDQDIAQAASYVPSITDTPATAKTKLTNLQQFLDGLLQSSGSSQGGSDNQTAILQALGLSQ